MISDQYYVFVFMLMATLPGIYLATKKNFIYMPNEKFNLFFIRLFFAVPFFWFFNILISLIVASIFVELFPRISSFFENLMGNNAVALVPFIFSLFFIILLKKYVIPDKGFKKVNYNESADEWDLYAFLPSEGMPSGKSIGTKYELLNPKRKKNELSIYSQLTDLIVDFRYLKGEYVMMTSNGEIVISNEALEILKENNLSGYMTRPVKKDRSFSLFSKPDPADDLKYKQMICSRIMPQMSPQTAMCSHKYPLRSFVSSPIYYNQSVLSEMDDFNQTFEYFGLSYFSQRVWILTKEARDLFIDRFNQKVEDFYPVYLVDDDGNVIEKELSKEICQ